MGLSESFNPLISLKFQLPNPANEVKECNASGTVLTFGFIFKYVRLLLYVTIKSLFIWNNKANWQKWNESANLRTIKTIFIFDLCLTVHVSFRLSWALQLCAHYSQQGTGNTGTVSWDVALCSACRGAVAETKTCQVKDKALLREPSSGEATQTQKRGTQVVTHSP